MTGRRRWVSRHRVARRGLSLLEVLLALGVLAVSLAVVGQLSAASARAVQHAAFDSVALTCAQSRLAELHLGMTTSTGDRWQTCREQTDLEWRLRTTLQPNSALLLVVVEVRERSQPASVFQLARLVRNPTPPAEGL